MFAATLIENNPSSMKHLIDEPTGSAYWLDPSYASTPNKQDILCAPLSTNNTFNTAEAYTVTHFENPNDEQRIYSLLK